MAVPAEQPPGITPAPARKPGLIVWLTGLSGAGKSTIAGAVEAELQRRGTPVEILDGDLIRTHFSKGLGFSKEDRDENVRRAGIVANLLSRHGVVVLVALVSPYRDRRDEIRHSAAGRFLEVYVNASLDVCEHRDTKGLYRRARQGALPHFTGVSDPYEPPIAPEVECRTAEETLESSAQKVLAAIDRMMA